MKIEYKNYIIEDDKRGYILSITGLVKDSEAKNYGETYVKEQVYPSSFENCLLRIFTLEKFNNKEKVSLETYIEKQKEIFEEMKTFFNSLK